MDVLLLLLLLLLLSCFFCFVQHFDMVSPDYLMLVIEILRHLTTFPEPQVFNLNLCLVFYLWCFEIWIPQWVEWLLTQTVSQQTEPLIRTCLVPFWEENDENDDDVSDDDILRSPDVAFPVEHWHNNKDRSVRHNSTLAAHFLMTSRKLDIFFDRLDVFLSST